MRCSVKCFGRQNSHGMLNVIDSKLAVYNFTTLKRGEANFFWFSFLREKTLSPFSLYLSVMINKTFEETLSPYSLYLSVMIGVVHRLVITAGMVSNAITALVSVRFVKITPTITCIAVQQKPLTSIYAHIIARTHDNAGDMECVIKNSTRKDQSILTAIKKKCVFSIHTMNLRASYSTF